VLTLRPKELCHAHVGASIDGAYGCARRKWRATAAPFSGLRPRAAGAARTSCAQRSAGSRYRRRARSALENEWSRAAPALLLLVCVPPARLQRHVRRAWQAQRRHRWRD
jgi:hypothetical protein